MITHNFSRRTFLHGVAATMALLWMDSLTVLGMSHAPLLRDGATFAAGRCSVADTQ